MGHGQVLDRGALDVVLDVALGASDLVPEVPDGDRVLGRLVGLTVLGQEVVALLLALEPSRKHLHGHSLVAPAAPGSGLPSMVWSSW